MISIKRSATSRSGTSAVNRFKMLSRASRKLPERVIIGGIGHLSAAGGYPDGPGLMYFDALGPDQKAEVEKIARRRRHLSSDANVQDGIFVRKEEYKHLGEIPPLLQKTDAPIFLGVKIVPIESPQFSGVPIEAGRKYDGDEPGTYWTIAGPGFKPGEVAVAVSKTGEMYESHARKPKVSSSGRIPDGIDLTVTGADGKDILKDKETRTTRLALYACSEALNSTGLDWEEVRRLIGPTRMSLSIRSAYGDHGPDGAWGYMTQWLFGESRIGNIQKVANSISDAVDGAVAAYILGPKGFLPDNRGDVAACATFGYNLNVAVDNIRSGKFDIALVGAAESGIYPWMVESFSKKAIAHDSSLLDWASKVTDPELRGRLDADPDLVWRMASRCFSPSRFGFVMGEGSTVAVLFSVEAARKLGVKPLGAIGAIDTGSDGEKNTKTGIGPGPYPVLGSVLRDTIQSIGRDDFQNGAFGLVHETATIDSSPWESRFWERWLEQYGLKEFPISAPKGWVGHTNSDAGGAALAIALAAFKYGIVPKIPWLKELGIGSDVRHEHGKLLLEHLVRQPEQMKAGIVMSAGFNAKNVAFAVEAPQFACQDILDGLDTDQQTRYYSAVEQNQSRRAAWQSRFFAGEQEIDYHPVAQEPTKDPDRIDRRVTKVDDNGLFLDGVRVNF